MTERRDTFSDDRLNALLDRQFDPAEQVEQMRRVRADSDAVAELCKLRDLKESMRAAYADPPVPVVRTSGAVPVGKRWYAAVAAGLFVAVLSVFLWPHAPIADADRFTLLDPSGVGDRSAQTQDEQTRVVFHVQGIEKVSPAELLDEVEDLLRDYRRRDQPVRVEVVAHGGGLDLVRAGLSGEKARIARMAKAYPSLTFVACRNTIRRLKVEKGVEVVLLPEARTTESGVAHVVRRQSEGWIYIQV